MATFILYINTDNAAFEENKAREVSRILYDIAHGIESADEVPGFYQTVFDINGNDVGRYAEKNENPLKP